MSDKKDQAYGEIDANAHQCTLNLLREAADYLRRLPAHPMTSAIFKKIDAHLESPQEKAQVSRLKSLAGDEEFRERIQAGNAFVGFSRFTPAGLPVIAGRLMYPNLELTCPAIQHAVHAGWTDRVDALAAAIAREIAEGVNIQLRPLNPVVDRGWCSTQFPNKEPNTSGQLWNTN